MYTQSHIHVKRKLPQLAKSYISEKQRVNVPLKTELWQIGLHCTQVFSQMETHYSPK